MTIFASATLTTIDALLAGSGRQRRGLTGVGVARIGALGFHSVGGVVGVRVPFQPIVVARSPRDGMM
jgi:hypothetical protein